MCNYFTNPITPFKEKCIQAEHNPTFCEKTSISSSASETKLVVVERSVILPTFSEEELKTEFWKQIKEFPKYYISNLGRVYSSYSEKILRPHLSPSAKTKGVGNPFVTLYDKKTLSKDKSHRYKPFVVTISSLMRKYYFGIESNTSKFGDMDCYILHKNNNVFDNRLSNLFLTKRQTLKKYVRGIENKGISKLNQLNTNSIIKDSLLYVFRKNDLISKFIVEIENGKIPDISVKYNGEKFVIFSVYDRKPFTIMSYYFRNNGDNNGDIFKSSFVCRYEHIDKVENHIQEIELLIDNKK